MIETTADILIDARDARSREVGQAIQATVSSDPALAVSIVGIGLDALSGVLMHSPDQLPGFGGWVDLIDSVYQYVMTGQRSPRIDSLLAGELGVSGPDTPR
jgi:hypothetical protein